MSQFKFDMSLRATRAGGVLENAQIHLAGGQTTDTSSATRANDDIDRTKLRAAERDPVTGLYQQWHSQPRTLRIIHVGAGATGLCTAYKMRNQLQDYELVCYEKNASIGGTWLESKLALCPESLQGS